MAITKLPAKERGAYTVGWIAPLSMERTAALRMFDNRHESLPLEPGDTNSYTYGTVGKHNVVLASMGSGTGETAAAHVANHLARSFPKLRCVLLVGIGGGVPAPYDDERDVRLGDVVISFPTDKRPGVIQWDLGKETVQGFKRTGALNTPPKLLLNAASDQIGEIQSSLDGVEADTCMAEYLTASKFPRPEVDHLFNPDYTHVLGAPTCDECDQTHLTKRKTRDSSDPRVFKGIIASGNAVMKNGAERDRISAGLDGILCFEMEAAGMMNDFPCLCIRGISDYCDSHKNDAWHKYAAASAAAYAKDLLRFVEPEATLSMGDTIGSIQSLLHTERGEIGKLLAEQAQKLQDSQRRQTEVLRLDIRSENERTRAEVRSEGQLNRADDERRFQLKQAQEERKEVMLWLSKSNNEQTSRPLPTLLEHVTSDGSWFADSDTVKFWMESDERAVLRCFGDAGVGKTVLSDQVRRQLEPEEDNDKRLVLGLYLAFDRRSIQSAENCLKSLLHQILKHSKSEISRELKNFKNDMYQSPEQSGLLALQALILDELLPFKEVFIVVDGLEELDEQTAQTVEDSLLAIRLTASDTDIRLVFFSRASREEFDEQIVCKARKEGCEISDMTMFWRCENQDEGHDYIVCKACYDKGAVCPEELAEDHSMHLTSTHQERVVVPDRILREFMEYELRQDASKTGRHRLSSQCEKDPKLKEQILSTVTERAQGSFLVVKFFMQQLKSTQSYLDTQKSLHSMPRNLHEAYDRFLKRLDSLDWGIRNTAQKLLTLCAITSRRLTTKETQQALSLATMEDDELDRRLTDTEFYDPRREDSVENAVDASQNLVNLEVDPVNDNEHLCSMHLTLREHLLSVQGPKWVNSHKERFARIMARFLNHEAFITPLQDSEDSEQDDKYPFYTYVAVHWPEHVRPYQENAEVQEELSLFLNDSRRISAWISRASQSHSGDFSDLFVQKDALALHICAGYGLYHVAESVANLETDINSPDPFFDRPPLVHAVREGQTETAEWLIKKGASPDIEDKDGYTGFVAAVVDLQADIVELILQKSVKVDINKKIESMYNRPPLMRPLINVPCEDDSNDPEYQKTAREFTANAEKIVRLLLADTRTDTEQTDDQGRTALSWATTNAPDRMFNLFFDETGQCRVELDLVDHWGDTPLHEAAKKGNLSRVKKLVEAGADLNVRDTGGGKDFLSRAIFQGHYEILEYMLNEGIEASQRVREKASSTKKARSRYNGFEVPDAEGRTLLHCAAAFGDAKSVALLIAKGRVDINAQDNAGETALHLVCRRTAIEPIAAIAQLLLEAGARTDILDKHQRLASDAAWQNGHALRLRQFEQLRRASVSTPTPDTPPVGHEEDLEYYPDKDRLPAWSLVRLGLFDDLRYRAKRGEKLDEVDPSYGYDALSLVLIEGDVQIDLLRALLAANVSISHLDHLGKPPLMIAVTGLSPQCTELLIQHGADVNQKSGDHQTALEVAIAYDNPEIVTLLVVNGATFDFELGSSTARQRALMMAVEQGSQDAVKVLCEDGANPWMTDANGLSPRLLAKLCRDAETLKVLDFYSDMHKVPQREKAKPAEVKPWSSFFEEYLPRSVAAATLRWPFR